METLQQVHAFLRTSYTFEGMSPIEEAGNLLLSPYRYFFRGIDVTYAEDQKATLTTTPYDPNLAVKALHVVLAILFPLFTLLGAIAKVIGRAQIPFPTSLDKQRSMLVVTEPLHPATDDMRTPLLQENDFLSNESIADAIASHLKARETAPDRPEYRTINHLGAPS